MYNFIQIFHSHNRNLIFLIASLALISSIIAMLSKKEWNKFNKISSLLFLIIMDIQFALGLALYFIFSPFGLKAFLNPDVNVMQNGDIRKIAVEHFILMLAALIVTHIGYKKIKTSINKHKTLIIYYGIALVLILAGIPWNKIV